MHHNEHSAIGNTPTQMHNESHPESFTSKPGLEKISEQSTPYRDTNPAQPSVDPNTIQPPDIPVTTTSGEQILWEFDTKAVKGSSDSLNRWLTINFGYHLYTLWLFTRSNLPEAVAMPFLFAITSIAASPAFGAARRRHWLFTFIDYERNNISSHIMGLFSAKRRRN